MLFSEQDSPRLAKTYILRNDGEYILAYKTISYKNKYIILPLNIALILPLFDGTNNLSDIKKFSYEIFTEISKKCPLEKITGNNKTLSEVIDQTITEIVNLGILELEGEKSYSLNKPEKLVPDIYRYNIPERLSRPLYVSLAFTNRCKYDCIYCYAERKKCEELELRQWIRIFDELKKNEIFHVDIAGADIFSRSDAIDILSAMAERDFVFLLSTKSAIDEKTAKSLAAMKIGIRDIPEHLIRYVQLSIDSVNPYIAGYMVKKEDHYEKTIESLKNLVNEGIIPRIKCVLTPLNYLEIPNIINEFSSLGVKDFHFAQYARSQYRHTDSLFLSIEQKEFISNFAESVHQNYPYLNIDIDKTAYIGERRNLSLGEWNNRPVCGGGRQSMIIQPNGDVTLCDQTPHNEEFIVGNVFDEGIIGVWKSKKIIEFIYPPRERFKNSVCHQCLEFEDCHQTKGYCYRASLSSYGTIYDAQPECPFQTKVPIREI